jgi:hypothetical protein
MLAASLQFFDTLDEKFVVRDAWQIKVVRVEKRQIIELFEVE